MRVKLNKRGLPRNWKRQWPAFIIAEHDIKVSRHSKLRAKLLIFEHSHDLQKFWSKHISPHDPLNRGEIGVVNNLACEIHRPRNGKPERVWMEADPRYFCVIGLLKGISKRYSAFEYVTHEAVHAAFCYDKRRKGNLFCKPGDSDEENICYPAGRIAREINRFLHRNGLY